MNALEALFAGIAPEHAPALAAGLLAAPWLAVLARRRPWLPLVDRWAAVLLGVSAAVHLALPVAPHHGGPVTAGFLASAVAYGLLAYRGLRGRSWRLASAPLVLATLVAYLVVVGRGEEADQVGIVTALAELAILGLAAVPGPGRLGRPRRLARFAGGATTVTATFLVGAVVWVASFAAHQHQPSPAAANPGAVNPGAVNPATLAAGEVGPHGHTHEHAGRAQAGVIMRPPGEDHHPTTEQQLAADELAAATAQAVARYANLDAALAAGYRAGLGMQGPDVHLENKAYTSDGVTLDPQRPEMLVYAVNDGRATLLGVVYVMKVAGSPGPAPGGPLTRWHAHNLCLSAAPPGLGIVSPFGSCPPLSVAVTSPEMMHVWVVDNPGGPFAEGLDKPWVWSYHAQHSSPYHRWL